jgi:hypothetical protein
MSERCPRCDAAKMHFRNATAEFFACDSMQTQSGNFDQSDACKIRQLTAERDALRERLSVAEEDVAKLQGCCEGRYGPVIDALHAAVLNDCEVRFRAQDAGFCVTVMRQVGETRGTSCHVVDIGTLYDSRIPQAMFADAIRKPMSRVLAQQPAPTAEEQG